MRNIPLRYRSKLRPAVAIILSIAVLFIFIDYIHGHPQLLQALFHTPKHDIVMLLLLYSLWFFALVGILAASLAICRRSIDLRSNILLNAYSTLVNFFVPGQGGIAVRGIYLKKYQALPYKTYLFSSLMYYGIYATLSALMLLAGNTPWWLCSFAVLVVILVSLAILFIFIRRTKFDISNLHLTVRTLSFLVVATMLQGLLQVSIFFVELKRANPMVDIHQAIAYTGAANFSLFVSLTPGAVGIREAFLIFSRHIYKLSTHTILLANLLDRAVFLIILSIIFLGTLGLHARYAHIFRPSQDQTADPISEIRA